jgi:hypothetical protein
MVGMRRNLEERKFDLVLRAKKTEGGILFSPMMCDINLE